MSEVIQSRCEKDAERMGSVSPVAERYRMAQEQHQAGRVFFV